LGNVSITGGSLTVHRIEAVEWALSWKLQIAANRCGVSAIVYSQPQCRRRKKGGKQRHGMSCFHFVAPSDDRPIGRSPAQQKPSRAGVEAFVSVSSIYFWNINRSVEPNKMI